MQAKKLLTIIGTAVIAAEIIFSASIVAAGTSLTVEQVPGTVSRPVFLTHVPGEFDRYFIVEQGGRIRYVSGGTIQVSPFLDITDRITCCGERGLLGLAFHPDFANNRYFYVNYTDVNSDTVVSRFEVPIATPNQADPDSEFIILTIGQPNTNHNGGWIAFGPNDGYLYIATGDGGGGCDPDQTGQDITNQKLGKMLRIDVDGGTPYANPPDNPFVGITGDDEIWAYGLRNPWRNAFDSTTGDLYIADVGQGVWEEVNYQVATSPGGVNYGWSCMEGNHCSSDSGCSTGACTCFSPSLTDPVHEYSHGGSPFRCSITGGEVYRGCAIPDLAGTYFFADYCSNQVWSLRMVGGAVTDFQNRTAEMGGVPNIASFGTDAYGEIYLCSLGADAVYKIVPVGDPLVDCNNTGTHDACDILDASATDGNDNDIPDTCEITPIPTVSQWGLVTMLLVLLAMGSILFSNRGRRVAYRR